MTTALWIIAICSVLRVLQNCVQLFHLVRDSKEHVEANRAFTHALQEIERQEREKGGNP